MSHTGIKAVVRLLVPACKAKPSPAIGQALGALGVNMMGFCKEFNERSKPYRDEVPVRVKLTARKDGTFSFVTRAPTTSWLLKQAAGIDKGATNPGLEVVGRVHVKQIYEIARLKKREPEFALVPLESLARSVVATCRSIGLVVDARKVDELEKAKAISLAKK